MNRLIIGGSCVQVDNTWNSLPLQSPRYLRQESFKFWFFLLQIVLQHHSSFHLALWHDHFALDHAIKDIPANCLNPKSFFYTSSSTGDSIIIDVCTISQKLARVRLRSDFCKLIINGKFLATDLSLKAVGRPTSRCFFGQPFSRFLMKADSNSFSAICFCRLLWCGTPFLSVSKNIIIAIRQTLEWITVTC